MAGKSDKAREPTQMVGFQMRLKESLRADLELRATASGSSLNGEVIARLERSLEEDRLFGVGPARALFIDIARQIALVEAVTGQPWHLDPATYWAVRHMAEDVLKRAEPPPPNAEAVFKLRTERDQLKERSDVLRQFLFECGAATEGGNALARYVKSELPLPIRELPVESWHFPKKPEQELDDTEREYIRERLAEMRAIEERLPVVLDELKRASEPWIVARTSGKVLYNHLTAPNEPEDAPELAGAV